MRFAPPRLLVALVLPLALAACGDDDSGSATPPEPGHVNVIDNEFVPDEITVAAGDTVTWDFKGAAVHNVIGDGFRSENKKSGSFEHTFEEAGSFDYVCTLHPGMEGTVVVE